MTNLWENVGGDFERHEKLNDQLSEIGAVVEVVALDDGKTVTADKLKEAMNKKGIKGIKPKDSVVITCEEKESKKKFEFWLSASNYTNLGELKTIRTANKDTLVGASFRVTRVSKNDTEKAAFAITKL